MDLVRTCAPTTGIHVSFETGSEDAIAFDLAARIAIEAGPRTWLEKTIAVAAPAVGGHPVEISQEQSSAARGRLSRRANSSHPVEISQVQFGVARGLLSRRTNPRQDLLEPLHSLRPPSGRMKDLTHLKHSRSAPEW